MGRLSVLGAALLAASLLDTGASATLVTPQAAARLALASTLVGSEGLELAGAGSGCQPLSPRRTPLPPLELQGSGGPLRIRGVQALVMPVAALPPGIDGVLGAPSLRRLPFLVDPTAGRLHLGAAALPQQRQPPRGRWRLQWRRGVPLLPVAGPAGLQPAPLDTGAEGLFLTPGLAARPLTAIVTENPIFSQLAVELIVGQELLRDRRQRWRLDRQPPTLEVW